MGINVLVNVFFNWADGKVMYLVSQTVWSEDSWSRETVSVYNTAYRIYMYRKDYFGVEMH